MKEGVCVLSPVFASLYDKSASDNLQMNIAAKSSWLLANNMLPAAGIPDWKLSDTDGWSPVSSAWKP